MCLRKRVRNEGNPVSFEAGFQSGSIVIVDANSDRPVIVF